MAASSSQSTTAEAVMETAPPLKSHGDNNTGIEGLSKRDPAVVLLSPVSGLEPLSWSDDHRLAASTTSSVSLVDLMCDINSSSQNLVLHRSHIPVPDAVYELEAGPKEEVQAIKDKFAKSKDPVISQAIMIDRVISPQSGRLRGVKYTSWSPTGCDPSGRCLLAFLTLENRLTLHSSHKPLQWTCLMDLTQLYGEMLKSRNYSDQNEDSIRDLDELQRRFQMQTPVRMEWSGLCSLQQAQTNSVCKDKSTVLLAVLMENGDVVVWQFSLPVLGKESIVSCSTIKSSISSPSALSWWEYEHAGRKMSGLIVGSSVGPVKILPVNLKAVKGHFTLKQPVILWQDEDLIPVHNVKCVTLFHSVQKCNCSLVVAARGPFVFWSLLLISKTGLNVHNSHVTGLHCTPIVSMTVNYNDGSVFTCSLDGTVMKLTPAFTGAAVAFKLSEIVLPEGVAGRRIHGISVSANGAYMAVTSSEGMTNGLHPVCLTYQVHFIPLRTAEDAAAELLESPIQNLFRKADLLDLLRWQILKDKSIPAFLLDNLDEKLQNSGSVYFWRLKLFALRVLQKSVPKSPVEVAWRPSQTQEKLDEEDEMAESSVLDESGREEVETHSSEEQMERIIQRIQEAERHLIRENMKKVLGEVYLHTCITQNTCVPAKGLCDFLTEDPANEDRAAKVLIGHVMNKLYKQTFPEHCSLCKDVLPFTDCKRTECKNGHRWLRCVLSYQACQGVTYRRCLLQDSIASVAEPEGEP